jgi:two-component system chemotaxis sensor kinase CheA
MWDCGVNEFLEQFLIESRELVEQATGDLLALEAAPDDAGHLDSGFRCFHTLKGAAGIVDFLAMGRLLHAAEDRLAAVRTGDPPASRGLIDECLACLDQVAGWLDVIGATGELPAGADAQADALIGRIAGMDHVTMPADWVEGLLAGHEAERPQARAAIRYAPDPGCFFKNEDPLAIVAALPDILALEITPAQPWPSLEHLDPFSCNLVITVLSAASPERLADLLQPVHSHLEIRPLAGTATLSPAALGVLQEQLRLFSAGAAEGFAGRLGSAGRVAGHVLRRAGWTTQAAAVDAAVAQSQKAENAGAFIAALEAALDPPAAQAAPPPDAAPVTLRVDVGRIDALVKLAGEFTVVKNALGHVIRMARTGTDPNVLAVVLKEHHDQFSRLVGELQRSVLGIRVLPLQHVFQRFPRLARDIAQSLGKSVRVATEGADTEADKAIVEALFEPLLHVIRNALDHGIESAERRRELAKSAVATIRLRAAREGGQIVIEVSDDGSGLDLATIRQVAAQRGIGSAEALAILDDAAVAELIFAPGFSTAAVVSDVSGRGVGMDAVRTTVARLGGKVGVRTEAGRGTSVTISLPFTVMLSRVLTVEAGGQSFGIPFDAVVETVSLPRSRVATLGAAQAVVLRDRTVPLIALTEILDLTRDGAATSSEVKIVVIDVAGQPGAIEVDRFGESLDVMLQPLTGLLRDMDSVAGTTLLGDGQVLIVLNLERLLQ